MKYAVVDLETTTKCDIGNNKANPMYPFNRIVLSGVLRDDARSGGVYINRDFDKPNSYHLFLQDMIKEGAVLVGHNIKFDMLYMLNTLPSHVNPLTCIPDVWDTQLAEYLLSGQTVQYASLDDLSIYYGGTLKDDWIKEQFNLGVPVENINNEKLTEYLIGDVTNTEKVFLEQLREAHNRGILPFIRSQMSALRATIRMNYSGMVIDSDYIARQITTLKKQIEEVVGVFDGVVKDLVEHKLLLNRPYSISSPKDVSYVLFGGEENVTVRKEVGVYKNGNTKWKNSTEKVVVRGLAYSTFDVPKNKLGYYVVDDDTLSRLPKSPLVDAVRTYRTLSKWKETYYENLLGLRIGDMVFPNISHVATKTGRLACSQPNLQNQTSDGGIKAAYISRWGREGSILELDYSQLEMVALAVLSGDIQLMEDIEKGVDMHTELYYSMYGRYPTSAERKPFKRLSFGLVYGAGATTLAKNAGCSKEEARKFIEVFYTRYAGVATWHSTLVKEANAGREYIGAYDRETCLPIGRYVKHTPTGRTYIFNEYVNDTPTWKRATVKDKKEVGFSIPELKNWPVQGLATGDIVPMMVGVLSDYLVKQHYADKVRLVMTVHDSVVLDVHNSVLEEVATDCKRVLESADVYVESVLGMPFPLKLRVGVSEGPSWGQQTEMEI